MSNWLRLGPVTIRTGSKHLASWGFPRIQIGGLGLWSHDNTGRLHLAGYHPRKSSTWHWFVALYRSGHGYSGWFNLQWRKGFGERGLTLFGWTLSITEQGYHKEARVRAAAALHTIPDPMTARERAERADLAGENG